MNKKVFLFFLLFFIFQLTYAKFHESTIHFVDGSKKTLLVKFPINSSDKKLRTKASESAESVKYETESILFLSFILNGTDEKLLKFGDISYYNRKGELKNGGIFSLHVMTLVTGVYGDVMCSQYGTSYAISHSRKDNKDTLLIIYDYMQRVISKFNDKNLFVFVGGNLNAKYLERASSDLFGACAPSLEEFKAVNWNKNEEIDPFLKNYVTCSESQEKK